MDKQFYVYIMTNCHNTVLYTGVTNDIIKRTYEHRHKLIPSSFTSKYNITKLVYYEIFDDAYSAISREKQIKGKNRKKIRWWMRLIMNGLIYMSRLPRSARNEGSSACND